MLFLLLISLSIFPEESDFRKGKLLFDFSFGSLKTRVSEAASAERFTNLYFLYDVNPLLQSENIERRNLGFYKALTYKESKIINNHSRIGFEYAILKYIGIGFSINQSRTKITNILPGDYLILYNFGIPPQASKNSNPEIGNYTTLFRRELNATISTSDLEIAFHYPYRFLDPYVRLGYGKILEGATNPSVAYKTSTSLGIRFFIPYLHLNFEYYQGTILGDLGRSNYAIENGFRYGIGFSF